MDKDVVTEGIKYSIFWCLHKWVQYMLISVNKWS